MPYQDIKINSQLATLSLGKAIGSKLKGNELIELRGDIGAGKTTLVKGLVVGAKAHSSASSPSFVIANEYSGHKFSIKHYDFYRLQADPAINLELSEAINDDNCVIIIEWSKFTTKLLPKQRLIIEIQATGLNSRHIILTYPKKYSYLI